MSWRWDQGRLQYFQFDVLKKIAKVLTKFNNTDISICEELFRNTLINATNMPFAPNRYTVIRNYKRVFECSFLATVVGKRLIVSDFCNEIAKENGSFETADAFFSAFIRRFRFPFAAFEDYAPISDPCYPFCAILKYLISLFHRGASAKITIDQVFSIIIGNNCNGTESYEHYATLKPRSVPYSSAELRQVREMLIFISQISILKLINNTLYLDVSDSVTVQAIEQSLSVPDIKPMAQIRVEEFLTITSISEKIVQPLFEAFKADVSDVEFIEGVRKRVEHFKVERSPLLREYYIQQNPQPICNMCQTDIRNKYPWTVYLLDIHHLLPLSSSLVISNQGTSLSDIIGLCPTCHRSIHVYYRQWLHNNNQDDFLNKEQARFVYGAATKEIAV